MQVRFFSESHNLRALRIANFQAYCDQTPSFAVILAGLQERGWLQTVPSFQYTMADFLRDAGMDTYLDLSPVKLLAKPLPVFLQEAEKKVELPTVFAGLAGKLEFYKRLILDVLNNDLAQQNYEEGVPDQENVSERVHALQAGKLAALVLPAEKTLPLLLHDIARTTNKDQEYGHAHHCEEGSVILAPLGLVIDYTRHHALAKYLLFHFCEPYSQGLTPETKGLISPVSTYSLQKQIETLGPLMKALAGLAPVELARFFFSIMFMRLTDDFSKVPVAELRRELNGQEPDYFSDELIARLLHQQLRQHLHQLDQSHEDKTVMLCDYEKQLDTAISLLARARQYTYDAALYEAYDHKVLRLMGGFG